MNIFELFSGKSYIEIVHEFIEKIYVHESKKFKCDPSDISIILNRGRQGQIQIMVYSNINNEVLRILPDKEAEAILMK